MLNKTFKEKKNRVWWVQTNFRNFFGITNCEEENS